MSTLASAETEFPALHPDAQALSAFRVLPDGRGRNYTVVEAPSGRRAVAFWIRRARALGFIKPPGHEPSYAMLDVWSDPDTGAVVQDFCIPHARAWHWWYRSIDLRVDYTDGDPIPEATR